MKKLLLSLTLLLFVTFTATPDTTAQSGEEATRTFLFVHGAWGGGHDYRQMESILEDLGHTVYRPTMTGQGRREHLNSPDVTLETHITDILNVIRFEQLEDLVIVGHSYGGMVITGVVDREPELFSHIIYLDAFLPEDGESLFSLSGEATRTRFLELAEREGDGYKVPPSWPDPWPDVPHPLGTLSEPVTLVNQERVGEIPVAYILAVNEEGEPGGFGKHAERAEAYGWPVYGLTGGHNLHREVPDELSRLILEIIGE
ncbi:MAG: alpha/beta hydrolase [Balneolaceae bacterium]